jgi:hypothetical protein
VKPNNPVTKLKKEQFDDAETLTSPVHPFRCIRMVPSGSVQNAVLNVRDSEAVVANHDEGITAEPERAAVLKTQLFDYLRSVGATLPELQDKQRE